MVLGRTCCISFFMSLSNVINGSIFCCLTIVKILRTIVLFGLTRLLIEWNFSTLCSSVYKIFICRTFVRKSDRICYSDLLHINTTILERIIVRIHLFLFENEQNKHIWKEKERVERERIRGERTTEKSLHMRISSSDKRKKNEIDNESDLKMICSTMHYS